MKATGIVRRIDDLGRVVIPKEIRRTMRIREGDPLEIYTSNDGEVIFKKYSAINEIGENAAQVAEIMHKLAGCPTVVFDRDHVVAVAGVPKKEFHERRVSPALEDLKFLEAQGVEILTCGTCLNYYGLSEKLQVGQVTNMYVIAEKMAQADKIIKP